jgi:hypothetical protein
MWAIRNCLVDFKSPDIRDPELFGCDVDFKSPDIRDPDSFA